MKVVIHKELVNCLVVDDHPLVCVAIETLLTSIDYIESVTSVNDGITAHKILKNKPINLLILDVNLGDSDGFDFLRRAKAHGYKGKVLFISSSDNAIHINTAFKMGADGYLCKSENFHLIADAIDSIAKGYSIFKFRNNTNNSGKAELSKREIVVFNYLVQGKSNKYIADVLSLSAKTVSTYKRRILDKYKVNSIVELIKASEC
ncbi:response regulator transcription factor [Vibrio pelagius]|uniref:Response regulator transcription factor n=1 Tax=Vibrio pelagius TaxID=28169 RepID=A0ABY5G398_VIBPE|nr:response regulator transcription factor [Vibrio pelagius]UTT84357.1 response regulator transcription factor [Vibrio pelagius]